MKNLIYLIIITLLVTSCNTSDKEEKAIIDYANEIGFKIKANDIKNADPAILFCYSSHLFEKGEKDKAVFWYYVAQYRYRFMSSCSEHLKAGSLTEAQGRKIYVKTGVYPEDRINSLHLVGGVYRIELYETIQAVLGKKINGYGYGDLDQMKVMIDQMLAYQQENPFNPMGLTPKPLLKSKDVQTEMIEKIKESYEEQKQQIETEADYIRNTRLENGLENRN